MSEQWLRLPPQIDLQEVLLKVDEEYHVEEQADEPVSSTYFDTFDWRLGEAGLSLSRRGSLMQLTDRKSGFELSSGPGTRKVKLFSRDLPDDGLRERLQPLIKERALLSRFTLSGVLQHFNLLNKDQKTVLRLTIVPMTGKMGDQRFVLERYIQVTVLRGYEKCWRKVKQLLLEEGLQEPGSQYDPVGMVQSALYIDPTEAEAKFGFQLSGQESVDEAVRDICLYLRGKLMLNVPGTLDDIDVEFLHDLRVSVRRTRSLLSLLKKQLPQNELAHFQQELKWVGSFTGPVRDLDVYLVKEEEFATMLPAELREGLPFFFEELAKRRRRELKKLRQNLRSQRFQTLLSDWELFLRQLPERQSRKGMASIQEVANAIIRKRLARIVKNGRAITPETADERVHELRIEGKKFRYLLEFFRSLYDGKLVDEYLRQMKKLQNVLGDFNDCSVQKEMLAHYLVELDPALQQTRSTAAALGGLVVHLHEEQRRLRASFEKTFAAFATDKNLGLIEQILAPPVEECNKEVGR